ncbi:cytidylyltransferase [Pyrenophora seminiperda CCB06]|uniref:Cytidylyltransferase n=1 Tax=Pyrenophora seminiperda CCB06 TaxID=1302712 RepID=A0A3M7LVA0_9PLEO|nr:cytidylyltransferase [Pyrenophora seminiperda CCB06]
MADMASRIALLRGLLPDFESALHFFTTSPVKFHVVRTVNNTTTQPKTLYILDSSFNPPSIAHLSLATSALKQSVASEQKPYRLLLLFSTHNADKSPSPASFVQRLALMTMFAEDLSQSLKTAEPPLKPDMASVSIDIGLTKEPYYSDKSAAIADTTPPFYPSNPIHVHLVGYDTLVRFCNPKYYPKHDPPLSALKPFFDANHKLRVTQRPANSSDESSNGFGTTEEQARYVENLKGGKHQHVGFAPTWANNIDMVQAEQGVGVSSTRVRNAAKEGQWDIVDRLCTEGVAAWIKDQALYSEDASGKKMQSCDSSHSNLLCCTAEHEGRSDSPELPNARISQPTPAKRPLLPKVFSSPNMNMKFMNARSDHLHELREIFPSARDAGDDKAAVRARFSRPSMRSLRSLRKVMSMRSIIRPKFTKDFSNKPPILTRANAEVQDAAIMSTAGSTSGTVVKQHGMHRQLPIIDYDLRNNLSNDKTLEQGGYDSDAEVLDDIAKNISKKLPIKRPSIYSIDWTSSTGSKATPESSTKDCVSAESHNYILPYNIHRAQTISLSNRLSHVFSTPSLRPSTSDERDRKLRRSHSATSMGLPKPSPISPLRLPSLTGNEPNGISWSEVMRESLRLSSFPVPPCDLSLIASRATLSDIHSKNSQTDPQPQVNADCSSSPQACEMQTTLPSHIVQIRVQQPTTCPNPRPSTSVQSTLPEHSPLEKVDQAEQTINEHVDSDPRHSVHLYSMRISHHLRSGSLLSWNQLIDAPDLPTSPRALRERTASDQSRLSHPSRQLTRHNRQTSSAGFATVPAPSRWGKSVMDNVDNYPDMASSTYSSRPQSPPGSHRGSLVSLSQTGTENRPFNTSSIDLRKLRRSLSLPTDNEDTPRPIKRHGGTKLTVVTGYSTEPSLLTVPRQVARKNSVADTKNSKFREEFSPSPPKKKLKQSSSIIRFLNPKRLSLRSQSEDYLQPDVYITSVDGPCDTTVTPADRERRYSRSLVSLQTEQNALGKNHGADSVWDRALQAHQEEKASLFLPKNRDLAVNGSLFRERSGSVSTRLVSGENVDSASRCDDISCVSTRLPGPPTTAGEHTPAPFTLFSRRSALLGRHDTTGGQELVVAHERQDDDTEDVGAWGRYPSHTRHDRTTSAGKADHVHPRDFALEAAVKNASAKHDDDLFDPTQRRPSTPLLPGEKKRKKRVGSGRLAKSSSMTFGKTLMKNYGKMFKSQSTEFRRHGRGHRSSIASGGILEHPELELLPDVWAGDPNKSKGLLAQDVPEEHGVDYVHQGSDSKVQGKLLADDSMATLRPRRNSSAPNLSDLSFRDGTTDLEPTTDRARVWSVYYENCVDSFPRLSNDADVALDDFGRQARFSFESKRTSMPSRQRSARLPYHSRNVSLMSHMSNISRRKSHDFAGRDDDASENKSLVSVRRSTMDLISKFKEQEATEHEKILSLSRMEYDGSRRSVTAL